MMTPLFSHPHAPRSVSKPKNPVPFALRARINIPTLPMGDLETKGISYAWRKGIRITSKSPRMKRMAVLWLLEEGSNIALLKEQAGGHRGASYILTRRALDLISKKYPELAGAVNYLIRQKYNPAKHPTVCIPHNLKALKVQAEEETARGMSRDQPGFDVAFKHRLLNLILDSRTDYKRLVEDNRRDASRSTLKRVTHEERNAIKARCYKTIAFTFPELYSVAINEASKLDPEIVKDQIESLKRQNRQ